VIVDTSALIAILRDETEAPVMARAIEEATERQISAANWLEAAAVIDGSRDPVASRQFDQLVDVARIVVAPVTEQQARIARAHTATSARAVVIPQGSTSVTASPVRSPRIRASRCCSRGATSCTPTSFRLCSRPTLPNATFLKSGTHALPQIVAGQSTIRRVTRAAEPVFLHRT
jgi:predicted nucleic acid-binding protein